MTTHHKGWTSNIRNLQSLSFWFLHLKLYIWKQGLRQANTSNYWPVTCSRVPKQMGRQAGVRQAKLFIRLPEFDLGLVDPSNMAVAQPWGTVHSGRGHCGSLKSKHQTKPPSYQQQCTGRLPLLRSPQFFPAKWSLVMKTSRSKKCNDLNKQFKSNKLNIYVEADMLFGVLCSLESQTVCAIGWRCLFITWQ